MALSVIQDPKGVDWPLGFVTVANNGTPVNIMVNVDPNNYNAPWSPSNSHTAEYTPTCHKVTFQGMQPAANNNGMTFTTGNVYIIRDPGNGNYGGPANRSDAGAMVYVLSPGGSVTIPADESDRAPISPYRYRIDVDTDGEGCLVTLLGCARA